MRARSVFFPAVLFVPLMLASSRSHATPLDPTSVLAEGDALSLQNTMREGVDALYEKKQPERAVVIFRDILSKMPSHYGASYQLAAALDAVGDPAKAQLQWQKVLESAQAIDDRPTIETAKERGAASGRAVKMLRGLELLYDRQKPLVAAVVFREVLAQVPTHYGASFHLARAVERSDHPEAAIELWNKVLKMAEGYNDKATEDLVRQSITALQTAPIMKQGLTDLYERRQPVEAAKQFRAVLKMLPTHYGATYQLAVALDEAKRPEEARPLWTKTLEMARSYNDDAVVVTAKERLAR